MSGRRGMVERYQMGGPAGSIDEPSKGFWPKTADLRVPFSGRDAAAREAFQP